MLFGTSNKTIYSPIPVLKRFQLRDIQPNGVIKTIVKASDYVKMKNPHSVQLFNHTLTPVRTTLYPSHIQKEQHIKGGTGASDNNLPFKVLLLYHYRYMSLKEYTYKRCVRGEADYMFRGCSTGGDTNSDTTTGARLASNKELQAKNRPNHLYIRPGVEYVNNKSTKI